VPTYEPQISSNEPETTIRPGARTTGTAQIPGYQAEIDGFYVQMRDFNELDLRGVLANLAAMSARASYMRSLVIRNEGRQAAAFRTRQIEPFLEEVDRQFKTWSRLQSVIQMEFDASKGGY
jgi:hypothetical protein